MIYLTPQDEIDGRGIPERDAVLVQCREWYNQHIGRVIGQLRHRVYRCPECAGTGFDGDISYVLRPGGKRNECPECRGHGLLWWDDLRIQFPDQAQEIRDKVLAFPTPPPRAAYDLADFALFTRPTPRKDATHHDDTNDR